MSEVEDAVDEIEVRRFFEGVANDEPHLHDPSTSVLYRAVLKNIYHAAAMGDQENTVIMLSVAAAILNTDDPIGAYHHQMKILAAKQIRTMRPDA